MKKSQGQILVGVIILLAVLAVLIPAMVSYIMYESNQSVKASQNTNAFQLAESAVDRAYQKIVESTTTWTSLQNGQQLTGLKFDTTYSDMAGGTYTISITSGPNMQQATIIAVGRDKKNKETRALKVVYGNSAIGSNNAIRSLQGITLGGSNEQVEWGSVMSPASIDPNGRNHPQFYSASSIIGKDTSPAPPNTDGVQWWSYYSGIPAASSIDLAAYKTSATATSTYYHTSTEISNFLSLCGNATTCDTGKTYYIDGNLDIGSPGIFVGGNLIIIGTLTLPNGRSGQGSPTVYIPQTAWKQYGANSTEWAYYKSGSACSESWTDPTAPATYALAVANGYKSTLHRTKTFTGGKVLVNGFIYVGGGISAGGGGGQSVLVGSAYVVGSVSFTGNNNCFFYTDEAASQILTTNVILTRQSWQDSLQKWPSALP